MPSPTLRLSHFTPHPHNVPRQKKNGSAGRRLHTSGDNSWRSLESGYPQVLCCTWYMLYFLPFSIYLAQTTSIRGTFAVGFLFPSVKQTRVSPRCRPIGTSLIRRVLNRDFERRFRRREGEEGGLPAS